MFTGLKASYTSSLRPHTPVATCIVRTRCDFFGLYCVHSRNVLDKNFHDILARVLLVIEEQHPVLLSRI